METALISNSFWTPILALDRLNSWVRSTSRFGLQGTLKRTIYWTKTHAILDISKIYSIKMRRVMVKTECRKCDGTGVFVHWYDWDYGHGREGGEPCLGCRATGTATLKFVETFIGPIRWHTPQREWYSSSLDVYVPFPCHYGQRNDDGYELTEWKPNQPGREMTNEEVIRDMLIIFRRWPHDVAFILDHYYDAQIERMFKVPDLRKGEAWIGGLLESSRPTIRVGAI